MQSVMMASSVSLTSHGEQEHGAGDWRFPITPAKNQTAFAAALTYLELVVVGWMTQKEVLA